MDVVYTYVNDHDPSWQATRDAARFDPAVSNHDANLPQRYRDRDELRYSLRSLATYLPCTRRVIVVVSARSQLPTWLRQDRVTVITHSELEIPTPCFNSHAIEANLHRIPGLSEPFLYFNDDMFLNRALTRADFVTPGGKYRVTTTPFATWQGTPVPSEKGHISGWKNVNSWLNRRFGLKVRHHLSHAPAVLSPSVMRELWSLLPDELAATTRQPFRSIHDYAVTCALHPHYSLATGRAVTSSLTSVNLEHSPTKAAALRAIRNQAFYCLNDGTRDQTWYAELQVELNPTPSPYEYATTFQKSR
jgi:Stealth protein CR2, conserved region 2/Stealth protein CR3, conserved region 3